MTSTPKKKARDAAYYRKNKDRITARHAKYYERKKAEISAQKAVYYQKSREHIKAYQQKSQALIEAYREKNKEQIAARKIRYNEKNKEHFIAWRAKMLQTLRYQFYDMYGLKKEGHEHGVCSCPGCGADLVMFGTISHIDGSGALHRKSAGWSKIIKDAIAVYNPSKYAAECFNCNCAANRYGGICPHKQKKKGLAPARKPLIEDYF